MSSVRTGTLRLGSAGISLREVLELLTNGVPAGVLAALSFGAGDFAGAVASRRSGALAAVAGAHGIGLIALLLALGVVRPPTPELAGVGLGLSAGIAGAIGLGALYRGMALGSMGLVTALSGAGSLVIPLLAGAVMGGAIGPLQLLGVGFAGAAAVAASGASRGDLGRLALMLAALAALGFGAWYVLLDLAARSADGLWALTLSRAASAAAATAVVAARWRRGVARGPMPWRLVTAAGLFDVGGNALYVLARDLMPIGLAAALTGMYPVVTMILARVILGEHLPRLGQLGVALALTGVVLISIG
jgi:drug/metabolite transporter (DMT)-like permease